VGIFVPDGVVTGRVGLMDVAIGFWFDEISLKIIRNKEWKNYC
jgi:hypothetical protein